MTEQAVPIAGADAQPIAVANSIDSIVDDAVKESAQKAEVAKTEEPKQEPEAAKSKELTIEEELEKLRKAKARDDRRIGKLTAQKYQALKEADELRAKYNPTPTQPSLQATELSPAKTGIPTKLNENNFKSYAEYIEARAEEIADYKIDRKFAEHSTKEKQTQQSVQEQAWVEERSSTIDKMAEEFAKENPEINSLYEEYNDVLQDYSKELKHAFLAADNPPLAFLNLAKDGKLEELASMSLVDAKVEIRLAQMKQIEKPKTKAPAPLPASRGSVAGGKRPEDLDGDEIRSWLRAK